MLYKFLQIKFSRTLCFCILRTMNNFNKLLLNTFATVIHKSDPCIFDKLMYLIILKVCITRGTWINSTVKANVKSCHPKRRPMHSIPFKEWKRRGGNVSCFLYSLCKLFIMYKGGVCNPWKQTALRCFTAEILTTLFVTYKEHVATDL